MTTNTTRNLRRLFAASLIAVGGLGAGMTAVDAQEAEQWLEIDTIESS